MAGKCGFSLPLFLFTIDPVQMGAPQSDVKKKLEGALIAFEIKLLYGLME